MKIYQVNTNYSNAYLTRKTPSYQTKYSQFTNFNGHDSFQKSSYVDTQINNLKNNIATKISPYENKYKQEFIQTGLIGYDSQEKLKLIRQYETELINKKLGIGQNEILKKIPQKALLYEKYANGIKEFERTAEFVLTHKLYATPEILNYIEINRPKIYRDNNEFEKLKPYYEYVCNENEKTNKKLEQITSAGMPEFSQKIKTLDEQNKTAAILLIISGYLDISDIKKETGNIIKAYNEKSEPLYNIIERIEKLNNKIQRFEEYNTFHEENISELKKFIEQNKNYKNENLTEKEIKTVYHKLLNEADTAILDYTNSVQKYSGENPVKISPRIIDRTFKSHSRINNTLNKLIQNEKQKIYEQTNNEFQKRFE